jgi:ATP-dependent DNA ligase
MADYIIQKAVNMDAVKKTHRKTLEEYARTYEAQHKYDGCCGIITLGHDGTSLCQSRTGEVYPSLDLVASELHHALKEQIGTHEGLVLIGEAWWPGKDQFSAISGEFRRLVPSRNLHFVINDVLTTAEFEAGKSYSVYMARMDRLRDAKLPERASIATRYEPGSYGCPQALCNELVEMGGFDGLILKDPFGLWERGRGTTGEIVKIKRVLSYDLRVVNYEPGKGKHEGKMGALVVQFGDKLLRVGTGFTDDQRENHQQFEGAIIEVEAMDLSSEGLLREPRFKGVRLDKIEPDAIAA